MTAFWAIAAAPTAPAAIFGAVTAFDLIFETVTAPVWTSRLCTPASRSWACGSDRARLSGHAPDHYDAPRMSTGTAARRAFLVTLPGVPGVVQELFEASAAR